MAAAEVFVGAEITKRFGKQVFSGKVTELWKDGKMLMSHVVYEDGGDSRISRLWHPSMLSLFFVLLLEIFTRIFASPSFFCVTCQMRRTSRILKP